MNGVYRVQLTVEFNRYPLRANSETGLEMWRENGDQWRIGRTNDYYYVCNEENPLQVWTSPGKTEYFTNLIELIMHVTINRSQLRSTRACAAADLRRGQKGASLGAGRPTSCGAGKLSM